MLTFDLGIQFCTVKINNSSIHSKRFGSSLERLEFKLSGDLHKAAFLFYLHIQIRCPKQPFFFFFAKTFSYISIYIIKKNSVNFAFFNLNKINNLLYILDFLFWQPKHWLFSQPQVPPEININIDIKLYINIGVK